ncbi:hypothetical protein ROZALSC1DRAFT_29016 [Rozella allomycis CSF55]|uniref:Uncharacterized protein n=1 Tax=Rozella allomycis (strain CSF55) TaxID=988480 RepID=A0A4P9YJ32_ROZAC|nr:hypothetical protein ROZALSC1DRAFT_29016 [Rozella allomycis CSF55]
MEREQKSWDGKCKNHIMIYKLHKPLMTVPLKGDVSSSSELTPMTIQVEVKDTVYSIKVKECGNCREISRNGQQFTSLLYQIKKENKWVTLPSINFKKTQDGEVVRLILRWISSHPILKGKGYLDTFLSSDYTAETKFSKPITAKETKNEGAFLSMYMEAENYLYYLAFLVEATNKFQKAYIDYFQKMEFLIDSSKSVCNNFDCLMWKDQWIVYSEYLNNGPYGLRNELQTNFSKLFSSWKMADMITNGFQEIIKERGALKEQLELHKQRRMKKDEAVSKMKMKGGSSRLDLIEAEVNFKQAVELEEELSCSFNCANNSIMRECDRYKMHRGDIIQIQLGDYISQVLEIEETYLKSLERAISLIN